MSIYLKAKQEKLPELIKILYSLLEEGLVDEIRIVKGLLPRNPMIYEPLTPAVERTKNALEILHQSGKEWVHPSEVASVTGRSQTVEHMYLQRLWIGGYVEKKVEGRKSFYRIKR